MSDLIDSLQVAVLNVPVKVSGLVAASFIALTFTAIDPVALIIASGGVLSILLSGAATLLGIRNAERRLQVTAVALGSVATQVETKLNAMAPVLDKVNVHVNSETDRMNAELASRDLQIRLQQETIEEMRKERALLAQAKALTDASNAIAQAAVAGATTPPVSRDSDTTAAVAASLDSIDVSAKQIEKNTQEKT